jgi:hypothetical protein
MSMLKSLFRPGQGQVLARYTAAIADAAMYPGDWVQLSTVAPGSQGVSGVVGGKTLGASDYVECSLLFVDSSYLGCGTLALGVVMGKSIGSVSTWTDVTSQVLADQDLCVIQSYGIHPNGRQAASGVLGDYLQASTTAGEPVNGVSGTVTGSLRPVGVCMVATGTYKRITAADEDGSVVFVHCS